MKELNWIPVNKIVPTLIDGLYVFKFKKSGRHEWIVKFGDQVACLHTTIARNKSNIEQNIPMYELSYNYCTIVDYYNDEIKFKQDLKKVLK